MKTERGVWPVQLAAMEERCANLEQELLSERSTTMIIQGLTCSLTSPLTSVIHSTHATAHCLLSRALPSECGLHLCHMCRSAQGQSRPR